MISTIFNDPYYFAIALAILGLMGGGLLSWLITFFYFKKSQTLRLLCYTTRDSDYLGYSRADFHNLSVHYETKRLVSPVRYTLYVWNCGNVTLDCADISKVDPLAFGQSTIEILEIAPVWSTRESINPKAIIDVGKKKILVDFDFLDPGDGFAVQFLADRSTPEARWQSRLEAYGTIKGLNRAPFRVAAGFETTRWWTIYVSTAAALFFGFSAITIAYDAWMSGMVMASLVKVLAALIFALITVAITAMSFEGFTERSYVIPTLLRKQNESEEDDAPIRMAAQLHAELESHRAELESLSAKLDESPSRPAQ